MSAQAGQVARQKFAVCSFLRGHVNDRIGARAFSALEGYAGRNQRYGAGSATADDQPPSWFSSEKGTKTDAKQQ